MLRGGKRLRYAKMSFFTHISDKKFSYWDLFDIYVFLNFIGVEIFFKSLYYLINLFILFVYKILHGYSVRIFWGYFYFLILNLITVLEIMVLWQGSSEIVFDIFYVKHEIYFLLKVYFETNPPRVNIFLITIIYMVTFFQIILKLFF